MFFKSEKKEIKGMVTEVVNGCYEDFVKEAEEIKGRGLSGEELENELKSAKRRHLSDCFGLTVSKVGEENLAAAEIIYGMLLDHEECGFNVDTEDGVMAGSIYAMTYYAITGKKANPADCIALNKQHALMISEVM